jgi:hypothetical protein
VVVVLVAEPGDFSRFVNPRWPLASSALRLILLRHSFCTPTL